MTSPVSNPSADRRYRLLIAGGLAVAAIAMFFAVSRTDTDDPPPPSVASRPDVVQQLIPRSDAEALRQSELGIDLAPGYEGLLTVNGIAIPSDETRYVDAENQLYFTPGPDKVIEELEAGQTCVVATVWRSEDGRGERDQQFRWCFDVL
jgi:hypothetical protein